MHFRTNDSVNVLNSQIQRYLPADATTCKSVDKVVDVDRGVHYLTEFLNSLELCGMPPQKLVLKVGSPIMPLKNLDAQRLCNDKRLRVK